MKIVKCFVFCFCIIFIFQNAKSEQSEPFSIFKNEVNALDKNIYTRNGAPKKDVFTLFTAKDLLSWWDIADRFVLAIYNNLLQNTSPAEYFRDSAAKFPDYQIEVSSKNNELALSFFSFIPSEFIPKEEHDIWKKHLIFSLRVPANGGLGWTYYTATPPEGIAQQFGGQIIPMDDKKNIFFIKHRRSWYGTEIGNGGFSTIGTFRIMERNLSTGKYRITVKYEDSNFYKKIALKRIFKYNNGNSVPSYGWDPDFDIKNVEFTDSICKFKIKYHIGITGDAYGWGEMEVLWEYGLDKKLKAIQYFYKPFSQADPNLNISEAIRQGKPVKIEP